MATQTRPSLVVPFTEEVRSLTVYVEAFAAHEYADGPTMAVFTVDKEFLERLTLLHDLCVTYNLSRVRCDAVLDWGPYHLADYLSLSHYELVVTREGDLWFTADIEHTDYHAESLEVGIWDLLGAVQAAMNRGEDFVTECGWSHEAADEIIGEYRENVELANNRLVRSWKPLS